MFDPAIFSACRACRDGSALAGRKPQGAMDRTPDLLGTEPGVQRLSRRAPAELAHHELVGPDLVVAGPERVLHPGPELGVPHTAPPLHRSILLTSATTYRAAGWRRPAHSARARRGRPPTPATPMTALPS